MLLNQMQIKTKIRVFFWSITEDKAAHRKHLCKQFKEELQKGKIEKFDGLWGWAYTDPENLLEGMFLEIEKDWLNQ